MSDFGWAGCSDPEQMVQVLQRFSSQRKLRLFAAACCRNIWALFSDLRSRHAVEVAEEFADGNIDARGLEAAWEESDAVASAGEESGDESAYNAALAAAWTAAEPGYCDAAYSASHAAHFAARSTTRDLALQVQADFLDDIFGVQIPAANAENGFLLAIRNPAVQGIALEVYRNRGSITLPILGDALEDAGCRQQLVLDHCRERRTHVRGCWLLDLLLDKK